MQPWQPFLAASTFLFVKYALNHVMFYSCLSPDVFWKKEKICPHAWHRYQISPAVEVFFWEVNERLFELLFAGSKPSSHPSFGCQWDAPTDSWVERNRCMKCTLRHRAWAPRAPPSRKLCHRGKKEKKKKHHFSTAKWDAVPRVNVDLIYYILFKCVIMPNGRLQRWSLLLKEVHKFTE